MSSELDTETVKEQVEDLRDCLEDLDDAFAPLKLKEKDSNLTSYLADRNLDPISRAKMLVTMAYSIDSLLFCHLKTTGINTDKHTIMEELQRIKQYVSKIKEATAHQQRNATVDRHAAKRIIGHDLSGNAAHDRDRALKTAQTNQRLKEKLETLSSEASVGKHTRFSNSGIMRDATERIVPGQPSDEHASKLLTVEGGRTRDQDSITNPVSIDVDSSEDSEPTALLPDATLKKKSDISTLQADSMFEETKVEKKNRERRERKVAKKDRQKKKKAKLMAKSAELASSQT